MLFSSSCGSFSRWEMERELQVSRLIDFRFDCCRQAYLLGHTAHTRSESCKMQFGGVLGPLQDYSSGNLHERDGDTFLKLSNYEDTVRQLDMYYGLGESAW